jgi:hypothetical protein
VRPRATLHVSFRDNELSRRDITGACVFAEAYAGAGLGGTSAAILFGMNPAWLAGLVLGHLATPFGDAEKSRRDVSALVERDSRHSAIRMAALPWRCGR